MKKIFILATAAIVAFASCMKTEVVSNSEPQEIGFRQFTGSMTKAEALVNTVSMGVFGYHNNPEAALYIDNGEFVYKEDSKWGGSTPYYWPLQGTMDFIVYAPYDKTDPAASYDNSSKVLTVTIDDNSTSQVDYLYGAEQYKLKTKSDGTINVLLKHALSKVIINIKAGSGSANLFTVSSIVLTKTKQAANYTYDYDAESNPLNITPTGEDKDMEYVKDGPWVLTETNNTNSKLVVPTAPTTIVIKYQMSGSSKELTATINLNDKWEAGKRYTYNITLGASEIFFNPTVEEWTNGNGETGKDETIG